MIYLIKFDVFLIDLFPFGKQISATVLFILLDRHFVYFRSYQQNYSSAFDLTDEMNVGLVYYLYFIKI